MTEQRIVGSILMSALAASMLGVVLGFAGCQPEASQSANTGGSATGASVGGSNSATSATGGASGSNGGSAASPGGASAGTAGEGGVGGAGDKCAALDRTQPVDLFLSADDSNSMASPVIARRLIRAGQYGAGYAGVIRTYEFLNYYDVGYPRAAAGTLGLFLELRTASAPGDYELQIGVSSPAAARPRKPMNFTFVLDTSGSMAGQPMVLEQAAVNAIASSLQTGDIASMVTWNDTNTVVLDSLAVTGPGDPTLLAATAALTAGGTTNLYSGLTVGYGLAQKNYSADRLNRVILISDGQANTGVTEATVIGDAAALNDGDGIYLVGVGVGDGVNDTLMDAVTDAGRGAYVYLDQAGEAQRMFVDRFDETMDVAARGVQVELKLPWYFGLRKFYGEAASSNPREVEPQHLAPDDAMVFVQDVVACSPEQVVPTDVVEVISRWHVPVTHVAAQASHQATVGELLEGTQVWQPKGRAIVAYAEALKKPTHASLTEARRLVDVADSTEADPDLGEIRQLIDLLLPSYPGST